MVGGRRTAYASQHAYRWQQGRGASVGQPGGFEGQAEEGWAGGFEDQFEFVADAGEFGDGLV